MKNDKQIPRSEEGTDGALLLSIQAMHVNRIFKGEKRFELRKGIPSNRFQRVFLYQTEGVGIVGHFERGRIIEGTPLQVWSAVGEAATSEARFAAYYRNSKSAVAIEILSARKYIRAVSLVELRRSVRGFTPPVSSQFVPRESLTYAFLTGLSMQGEPLASTPPKVVLTSLNKDDENGFLSVVSSEVASRYPGTGLPYVKKLVELHYSGTDRDGFFSESKRIFTVRTESGHVLGYTVVTYKYGASLKTGPTVLFPEFRGLGFGSGIRVALDQLAVDERQRKIYCTCPDLDSRLISHFLRNGYKIEAHLKSHYSDKQGEVVLGKRTSSEEIKDLTARVERKVTRAGRLALGQKLDKNSLVTGVIRGFSATWFHISKRFAERIIRGADVHLHLLEGQEKARMFIPVVCGGRCEGGVFLIPKRDRLIKGLYAVATGHPQTTSELLSTAEKMARSAGFRKLYYVHPIEDAQVLAVFEALGYEKEGLLHSLYRPGCDTVLISKIFY